MSILVFMNREKEAMARVIAHLNDPRTEMVAPIKCFGYRYAITNHGNVLSFSEKKEGKPLIPYVQKNSKQGYQKVYLYKGKTRQTRKSMLIHRLVAEHFIPNPSNLPEVNHIDNDRTNNHYSNLEWTTRKANCEHASGQGRYNSDIKREKPNAAKLTKADVIEIRSSPLSNVALAKRFKVGQDTISNIRTYKTWKSIS